MQLIPKSKHSVSISALKVGLLYGRWKTVFHFAVNLSLQPICYCYIFFF